MVLKAELTVTRSFAAILLGNVSLMYSGNMSLLHSLFFTRILNFLPSLFSPTLWFIGNFFLHISRDIK